MNWLSPDGWVARKAEATRATRSSKPTVFLFTCTETTGEVVDYIRKHGREITLRTFRKYVDTLGFEKAMGYDRTGQGLTLARDWHVAYYKSRLPDGRRCYFLNHSGIEWVWSEARNG